VYFASEFALEAVLDALRLELALLSVLVVLVEPGVIDTPLHPRAAADVAGYDQTPRPNRATWQAGFGFRGRF
jgi:NAD(P)-dependent dehydrogenase (short-subunit alcohol dehydrogenase family)